MNPSINLVTPLASEAKLFATAASTSYSALTSAIAAGQAMTNYASAGSSKVDDVSTNSNEMDLQLFDATAKAKIWTSRIAMHLNRMIRDRLFRQLDSLHNTEEWVAGETPVNIESYKTCVRAIVHHEINSGPSLSLMPSGNILAMWRDGEDKLTIEFLPGNQTKWFVQNQSKAGRERVAGNAPLERLREVLFPYCADRWFDAS